MDLENAHKIPRYIIWHNNEDNEYLLGHLTSKTVI